MSSSELSGYRLHSLSPIELRVYDSEFRQVDRGVGSLEKTDLRPGIYHIELRAGANSSDKLIKLEPGQTYEDLGLQLNFYSVLPLPSEPDADSRHLSALQGLSANPPLISANGSVELVVFIRIISAQSSNAKQHLELINVQLLDSNLTIVRDFDKTLKKNFDEGWWGKCGKLPAGGYLLRVTSGKGGKSVDLALFLSDSWQTLVCIPITTEGLQLDGTLIQMLPMGSGGFVPNLEFDRDFALSLEVATSGLAAGQAIVPRRQLDGLIRLKFRNPMLGIIAAYCMFDPVVFLSGSHSRASKGNRFRFKSPDDVGLLRIIITNLNSMLPRHPDVLALWQLYHSAEGPESRAPIDDMKWDALTWPPMVALGYRQIITSDELGGPNVIHDSLADWARFWTVPCGAWTAWRSENTTIDNGERRLASSFHKNVLHSGMTAEWVSPGIEVRGTSLFALAIVRDYLAEVARTEEQPFSEVVRQLTTEDLSLNTGLGRAQVEIAQGAISNLLNLSSPTGTERIKFVAPVIEASSQASVDLARAWKTQAIDRLHSLYERDLQGYLRARCRDRNDVEDVVNDAWLLIGSKIHQLDPERGSWGAFIKYWASIAALRWYRQQKNRAQQTILFTDLISKFPGSINEPDIAEVVQAREPDPEQLMARDEQYQHLLNLTFSTVSPPHQLIAFGFCKLLEWRPRKFVENCSDISLEILANVFQDQYQNQVGENKEVVASALDNLRQALQRPPDPSVRAAYTELARHNAGNTTPREYYRTETPEESVSHWVYAVRRRVQRALLPD